MNNKQIAILVDAGYLCQQGITVLAVEKKNRSNIALQDKAMVQYLIKKAKQLFGTHREVLRIYWYDASPERGVDWSEDQMRLGQLPEIKLRMGVLNAARQQKGVDALLCRDMEELASRGAVDSMLLISGDEDLHLALETAQSYGVKVKILGVGEEGAASISLSMMLESDGVDRITKEELKTFMGFKEANEIFAKEASRPAATPTPKSPKPPVKAIAQPAQTMSKKAAARIKRAQSRARRSYQRKLDNENNKKELMKKIQESAQKKLVKPNTNNRSANSSAKHNQTHQQPKEDQLKDIHQDHSSVTPVSDLKDEALELTKKESHGIDFAALLPISSYTTIPDQASQEVELEVQLADEPQKNEASEEEVRKFIENQHQAEASTSSSAFSNLKELMTPPKKKSRRGESAERQSSLNKEPLKAINAIENKSALKEVKEPREMKKPDGVQGSASENEDGARKSKRPLNSNSPSSPAKFKTLQGRDPVVQVDQKGSIKTAKPMDLSGSKAATKGAATKTSKEPLVKDNEMKSSEAGKLITPASAKSLSGKNVPKAPASTREPKNTMPKVTSKVITEGEVKNTLREGTKVTDSKGASPAKAAQGLKKMASTTTRKTTQKTDKAIRDNKPTPKAKVPRSQ